MDPMLRALMEMLGAAMSDATVIHTGDLVAVLPHSDTTEALFKSLCSDEQDNPFPPTMALVVPPKHAEAVLTVLAQKGLAFDVKSKNLTDAQSLHQLLTKLEAERGLSTSSKIVDPITGADVTDVEPVAYKATRPEPVDDYPRPEGVKRAAAARRVSGFDPRNN